mmetsp:Transcript_5435/g.16838  ORF Transcript_5435/g.16838 Transcript_5435/m.16838 type:complete len:248 (-) Transcript_5435:1209-1952(-)
MFISAAKPLTSKSESWQLCTCASLERRILKTASGGSVFSPRCDSSLREKAWISARSTVTWSTTGSLLCSSSSWPRLLTLAAPSIASSALTFWRRASSCSAWRRSAVSTKVFALHMWGISAHRMPRYVARSTSPLSSGSLRQRSTWICSRERQTSLAPSSALRTTQSFIVPCSEMPSARKRRTRCVLRDSTSVSTKALSSASLRRFFRRSARSSMCTKPSSSSGSICSSICTSCGPRRSGRVSAHSRQ